MFKCSNQENKKPFTECEQDFLLVSADDHFGFNCSQFDMTEDNKVNLLCPKALQLFVANTAKRHEHLNRQKVVREDVSFF